MGSNGRRTDASVEEALFEQGYEFEFFQAARLLARIFPDRKDVGRSARPAEEFARFVTFANGGNLEQSRLAMAFPASAIHDIKRNGNPSEPVRMYVAFMGLTGTQGVLPLCYTEHMLESKAAKENALAAFLDLFNHRLVSLFYRAWQKHKPAVLYEIAAVRKEQPDALTQYLFDLIGMGTPGLRGRLGIQDESLLLYAGLIAQRPHSATALRGILRDYFSIPVEIDQCIGSWYELEDADRCYLSGESERNQLGVGSFIGDEVWDQQARFRIRVGPVGLKRFKEFLPDSDAMAKFVGFTRFLVGQAMVFDVQVFLRADEMPYFRLDDEGFRSEEQGGLNPPLESDSVRLGWMGWLKTSAFGSDAGESVSTWS
jgi:type VI secretion system protein ImpH